MKKFIRAFVLGLIFAVLAFLGINAIMEPFSTSEYCGSNCHEMNISYQTWELSPHGANALGYQVECIDCHLPSKDHFFTHITAKGYAGAKDMYKHHFGPEYDREKIRQQVVDHISNDRCTGCHDKLLKKAGSSAARKAHTAVINDPDAEENRCVKCHESVGHNRTSKLYTPEK